MCDSHFLKGIDQGHPLPPSNCKSSQAFGRNAAKTTKKSPREKPCHAEALWPPAAGPRGNYSRDPGLAPVQISRPYLSWSRRKRPSKLDLVALQLIYRGRSYGADVALAPKMAAKHGGQARWRPEWQKWLAFCTRWDPPCQIFNICPRGLQ